ncbi:hypothetical protein A2U01_0071171, partial [Trifolium medium]|nr:hypothetical protein [Trifolium medium]
ETGKEELQNKGAVYKRNTNENAKTDTTVVEDDTTVVEDDTVVAGYGCRDFLLFLKRD